jgi:site-specific recombinase XerD
MTALAIPDADQSQSFLRLLRGVDRHQARQWFENLLDAAAAGSEIWSDAELTSRFLAQCSRTGSRETRDGYARELQHLSRWLEINCPGVPLRLLTPPDAEQAVADLRAQVEAGEIKPRTFNRRLAVWSSLWRWASEPTRSGVSGFLRSIWPRRAFLAVEKVSKPLVEGELTELVGAIATAARSGLRTAKRDLVLVRLTYLLGARVSEVSRLQWGDVERLDDGGLVTITRGKGGKSRTIRVSTATVDLIESLGRGEAESWLFPSNRSDGPLTRQAIGDRVRRWGRQVGLHVWPHRLRHSHATAAVRAGVDVFVLQATLGHSSTSTTSNYVLANPHASSSLRLG